MEDNPTPPPPPAPAAAHLPKLPSNAEIVRPRNADVSLLILHAVFSRGPHRPGGWAARHAGGGEVAAPASLVSFTTAQIG